jgi:hypothetical protein
MSDLSLMTREELYQEVLRLRSCMTGEHGLADKVPTEIWLAYERRATDYAAMYGNGSAALKAGILRLTLDAWLSGRMAPGAPSAWVVVYADGSRGLAFTADEADEAIAEAHAGAFRVPLFALSPLPSSKLGDATQKTGQSAENAEGDGPIPSGGSSLINELASALADAATPEQTAKEASFVAAGGAKRVEDHYSNQRFCMFAIVVVDGETGARHWECTEDGGGGEVSHEAVVELDASTFATGTTIEVREPRGEAASRK